MTRIKICGITNARDALAAAELGADALGFIFADSPRRVDIGTARRITALLPPFVLAVGVFKDASLEFIDRACSEADIHTVQLHGTEPPGFCVRLKQTIVKRIMVHDRTTTRDLEQEISRYSPSAFLLDPGNGGGRRFDWSILRPIKARLIIAGGLSPTNVRLAIGACRPYGVDVCSGVEISPGKKDLKKMRSFIQEVRSC